MLAQFEAERIGEGVAIIERAAGLEEGIEALASDLVPEEILIPEIESETPGSVEKALSDVMESFL